MEVTMNKNYINSMLLVAMSLAIAPTTISAEFTVNSVRKNALETLKKAKAAMPDPEYWKDKTVKKAKRMWFCFKNKSQCSASEAREAQAWIYGTSAVVVTALLALGGVAAAKSQADKKWKASDEYQFILVLAQLLNQAGYSGSRGIISNDDKQAISAAVSVQFDQVLYPQFYSGDIVKDEYFNKARSLKIGSGSAQQRELGDTDFEF
jgi:hypothetical protein